MSLSSLILDSFLIWGFLVPSSWNTWCIAKRLQLRRIYYHNSTNIVRVSLFCHPSFFSMTFCFPPFSTVLLWVWDPGSWTIIGTSVLFPVLLITHHQIGVLLCQVTLWPQPSLVPCEKSIVSLCLHVSSYLRLYCSTVDVTLHSQFLQMSSLFSQSNSENQPTHPPSPKFAYFSITYQPWY